MLLTEAFPSTPGYRPNLDAYWEATWWVLFPIATFLAFRRHAWLPILALGIGGWEDIMFYWIQGRGVPATLAYLPQTPTAELLYLRAVLFLAASTAGVVLARVRSLRVRFVSPEAVLLVIGVFVGFWGFLLALPAYVATKWLLDRVARGSKQL